MKRVVLFGLMLLLSQTVYGQLLMSSTPADGATAVDPTSDVSFTFDKKLDPGSMLFNFDSPVGILEIANRDSLILPETGLWSLSADSLTITFDLDHKANTYFAWILTGAVFADGDSLENPIVIEYTTSSDFSGVSVSGTVSAENAPDAENAVVALLTRDPFSDSPEVEPAVVAADLSSVGGSFVVHHVPAGVYWPVAVVDKNGDGRLGDGELIGVSDSNDDNISDSLVVQSDNISGITLELKSGDFGDSPPDFVTARALFDVVLDSAINVFADAALTDVNSYYWPDSISTDGTAPGWMYSFYSSASEEFVFFEVWDSKVERPQFEPAAKARPEGIRRGDASRFYMPDSNPLPENWIDSDAVAAVANANGAELFMDSLSHPVIFMMLNSSFYDENQQQTIAAWSYTVEEFEPMYDGEQTAIASYKARRYWVDALSGELLMIDDLSGGPGPQEYYSTAGEFFEEVKDTAANYLTTPLLTQIYTYQYTSYNDIVLLADEHGVRLDGFSSEWEYSFVDTTTNDYTWVSVYSDDVFGENHRFKSVSPSSDRSLRLKGMAYPAMIIEDGWIDSDAMAQIAMNYGIVEFAQQHDNLYLELWLGESYNYYFEKSSISVEPDPEPMPLWHFALSGESPMGQYQALVISIDPYSGVVVNVFDSRNPLPPFDGYYSTAGEFFPQVKDTAASRLNNPGLMDVYGFTFTDSVTTDGTLPGWNYSFVDEAFENMLWIPLIGSEIFVESEQMDQPTKALPEQTFPRSIRVEPDSMYEPIIIPDGWIDSDVAANIAYLNGAQELVEGYMDVAVEMWLSPMYGFVGPHVPGQAKMELADNHMEAPIAWHYVISGNSPNYEFRFIVFVIDAYTGELIEVFDSEDPFPFPDFDLYVTESSIAEKATDVAIEDTLKLSFNKPLDDPGSADFDDMPIDVASPDDESHLEALAWYLSDGDSTINIVVRHLADTDYSWIITDARGADGDRLSKPFVLNYTTKASYGNQIITGLVVPPFMDGPMPGPGPEPQPVKINVAEHDSSEFNFGERLVAVLADDDPFENEEARVLMSTVADSLRGFEFTNVRDGMYYPLAFSSTPYLVEFEQFYIYDPDNDGSPDMIELSGNDVSDLVLTPVSLLDLLSFTAVSKLDSAKAIAEDVFADNALHAMYSMILDPRVTGRGLFWDYIFYSASEDTITAVYADIEDFDYEIGPEDNDDDYLPFNKVAGGKQFEGIKSYSEEEKAAIDKIREFRTSEAFSLPLPDTFIDSDEAAMVARENGIHEFVENGGFQFGEMSAYFEPKIGEDGAFVWKFSLYRFGFTPMDIYFIDVYVDMVSGDFLRSEERPLFEIGGLEVLESSIANYEAGVDTIATLELTFNQALAHDGDDVPIMVISPNDSATAALIDLQFFDGDSTLAITVDFNPETDYSFILTQALGVEGGLLAEPFILNFTTYDAFGPHTVSGVLTADLVDLFKERPELQNQLADGHEDFSPGIFNNILVGLLDRIPEEDEEFNFVTAVMANENLEFEMPNVRDGEYFPVAFVDLNQDGEMEPGYDLIFTHFDFGIPSTIEVSGADISDLELYPFFEDAGQGPGHDSEQNRGNALRAVRELYPDYQLELMGTFGRTDSTGNAPGWIYIYSNTEDDSVAVVIDTPPSFTIEAGVRADFDLPAEQGEFLPDMMQSSRGAMQKALNSGGRAFMRQHQNVFVEMIAGDALHVLPERSGEVVWVTIFYPEATEVPLTEKPRSLEDVLRTLSETPEAFAVVTDAVTGDEYYAGTYTSREDEGVAVPDAITLYQNYPNPFNPSTQIKFAIPAASEVRLRVYDLTGRVVADLVNGSRAAGEYVVTFNASNLSSGMYLYRLEAQGVVQTKKLLLVK